MKLAQKPVPLVLKVGVGMIIGGFVSAGVGLYGVQMAFEQGENNPLLYMFSITVLALIIGIPLTLIGLIAWVIRKRAL